VIVGAHPDDETAGAAGLLLRCERSNLWIVTVTDGAPRDPADAERAGYTAREDYAAARRQELLNALPVAAVPTDHTYSLNIVDQEASFDMTALAHRIADTVRELRPTAVLTHPYEGGHPDHDATAFAVHAACAMLAHPPEVYEFTSYHADPGKPRAMRVGHFLPGTDTGQLIPLSEKEIELKQKMFECYASQAHVLRHFPLHEERFRAAPAYDFTEAPHAGTLFYENFPWGMTGDRWRQLATESLSTLAIPERV